jgi:hypothetical protein
MMTPFSLFSGDSFATPKSAVRVKETKKRIAFSDVNIFYFNRVQGFSSVPRYPLLNYALVSRFLFFQIEKALTPTPPPPVLFVFVAKIKVTVA